MVTLKPEDFKRMQKTLDDAHVPQSGRTLRYMGDDGKVYELRSECAYCEGNKGTGKCERDGRESCLQY